MNEIKFIKWKWLICKDIDNFNVWWYFEISESLWKKIPDHLNKTMTLNVKLWDTESDFICSVDTSTKSYLSFVKDHWILKLAILIQDIELAWIILKWDLKLILE
jgi:hypothetical protein